MTHLDIFSGIGGFALASDRVWPGIEHTFVEYDPFCQAVLRKHYPNSTIHGDIDQYVVELTGLPAKEYNALHGLSTVEQVRERSEPLSKRDVGTRHRELLRSIETSDVENTVAKGMRDAEQLTIQGKEPFSPRHGSERPSAEHFGESDTERGCGETEPLRDMQGHGYIQGWQDEDTSTPCRLLQTTRHNMAVPEMSPQMAQKLQSNPIKYERTTADAEREGWSWESWDAERQHRLRDKPFILTGGFPCQEFSHAGKRKGTAGSRYKWPEMLSVIHYYKPEWVIAENVRGITTWERGLALETVLTNLEECGYAAWSLIIPACAVGAPHRRDRVWIVAHAVNSGQRRDEQGSDGAQDSLSQEHRTEYSTTRELERADCDWLSDGHAPNTRQQLREPGSGEGMEADSAIRTPRTEANQREREYTWADDWREVALATCNDSVDDGPSFDMDGTTISRAQWRKEALKACGNAIVPQVAEQIMRAIPC